MVGFVLVAAMVAVVVVGFELVAAVVAVVVVGFGLVAAVVAEATNKRLRIRNKSDARYSACKLPRDFFCWGLYCQLLWRVSGI